MSAMGIFRQPHALGQEPQYLACKPTSGEASEEYQNGSTNQHRTGVPKGSPCRCVGPYQIATDAKKRDSHAYSAACPNHQPDGDCQQGSDESNMRSLCF